MDGAPLAKLYLALQHLDLAAPILADFQAEGSAQIDDAELRRRNREPVGLRRDLGAEAATAAKSFGAGA